MTNNELTVFLQSAIESSGMEIRQISKKSGVSEEAIRAWKRGATSPRVQMLIWVLDVIGYKLEVVKKCQH